MKYQETLLIDKKDLETIKGFLENKIQGDNTLTYSVMFDDCMVADIKCCGCVDDTSWAEMVLFEPDRWGGMHEVCCSEPCYEFEGEWKIKFGGNTYIVKVKPEN